MKFIYIVTLVSFFVNSLFANGLKLEKIDDNIYAIVGDLTNRTPKNLGNNSTHGFIVTKDGVVLIDAGGTYKGAKAIHEVIKTVTNKDIKIVINSGGQDHRWMGNSYFKSLGANIIASKKAVEDQKDRLYDELTRLEMLAKKDALVGTKPLHANEIFDNKKQFTFGGIKFELYHEGHAHTLGDTFIWLPQYEIMFTGDIVYTQRMLGVGSWSNHKSWIKVFEKMASFNPKVVVPGHGKPTTLKVATNDTYDYLQFLNTEVLKIIDNDGDLTDATNINQSKFNYLFNFEQISKKNASRVFMQLEF